MRITPGSTAPIIDFATGEPVDETRLNGAAHPHPAVNGGIGHNSGKHADPGLATDLDEIKGPLAIRKDTLPVKEMEAFATAIRSQGNADVRQPAITNAMHRARANPRISHLAYRLAEQIASRSRWQHRYHSEPNEAMAHYIGLDDARNLARTLELLCEEQVLKRISVPRPGGGRPMGFYTVVCTADDRSGKTVDDLYRAAKVKGANLHHEGLQTFNIKVRKPSPRRNANLHHDGHTVDNRTVEREEGANAPTGLFAPNDSAPSAKARRRQPELRQEAREAFNIYVETAQRFGLAVPEKADPWLPSIAARLRESGGLDGWKRMLVNVESSAFLCGESERDFRADLDWLVKPKNFHKVLSGKYSNRRSSAPIKAF